MNKIEQLQEQQQIQKYLQDNNVYTILQKLLEDILINKPTNPIDFMLDKLSVSSKQKIFIIGPPGLRIYQKLERALSNVVKQIGVVSSLNCGNKLAQKISSLSAQSKQCHEKFKLMPNEQVNKQIIPAIKKLCENSDNIIIQGYPKNLEQAITLQKQKIYPTKVIFINVTEQKLEQSCAKLIKQKHSSKQNKQKQKMLQQMLIQYFINIRSLKQFYKSIYLEIDYSGLKQDQQLISQLERNLKLNILNSCPKKSHQIILIGSPLSGRTTLGKKIAVKYGLVYVSTAQLIAEEIRRDTINGKQIKKQFQNKELIDNFVIEKLIDERIKKTDCQMQGFILQGYPKNQQQWKNLANLKIDPSYFIILDAPQQLVKSRNNYSPQLLTKRFEKWRPFSQYLKNVPNKTFWVNPTLSIQNLFQEVSFQLQRYS